MQSPKTSLKLVMFESVITAGLLSVPIMTPFFVSIGLNQKQIALSQMIFTIVIMVLNIPTGWIADRFSRKWANIIGDLGCAMTLIFYSQAQSFTDVIICETLFGVFLAFSQGVDSSLIRHFSTRLDSTEKLFVSVTAKVASMQYACNLVLMLLGGPIGTISFRLAVALSAVTYFAGGVAALFIKDDSDKLVPTHNNPLKDIVRLVKETIQNPALRLRIFAFTVAREVTHGIIWVFTPLMLLAGVPIAIVSVGWAINSVASYAGAQAASRLVHRLKEWQIFAVPMIFTTIGLVTMSIHFGLATIWLYFLMGATQGWTSAAMLPLIQRHARINEQTSIISIARVVSQLLYIPTVWLIGVAADIKTEYSMLATLLIFVPLSIPIIIKLRREP